MFHVKQSPRARGQIACAANSFPASTKTSRTRIPNCQTLVYHSRLTQEGGVRRLQNQGANYYKKYRAHQLAAMPQRQAASHKRAANIEAAIASPRCHSTLPL